MRVLTSTDYKKLKESDLRNIADFIGEHVDRSSYLSQVEDFYELENSCEKTISEALHYAEYCWDSIFS